MCVTVGWTALLNLVTFGLGFGASYYLGTRTANRKEDHDLLDAISKLVSEVEQKAFQYYALPGNDSEAKKIASEIRSLNSQIGRAGSAFYLQFQDRKILGHVNRLKETVTCQLDDSSREAFLPASPIFEEISQKCRVFIGDLHMQFSRRYRGIKQGPNF